MARETVDGGSGTVLEPSRAALEFSATTNASVKALLYITDNKTAALREIHRLANLALSDYENGGGNAFYAPLKEIRYRAGAAYPALEPK